MYHNAPGHLEDGTFTPGQHKHKFTEDLKRGGYVPSPLLAARLREAVLGFLDEEKIEVRGRYLPFTLPTTVDAYAGKVEP
jgi:hypothetical protein